MLRIIHTLVQVDVTMKKPINEGERTSGSKVNVGFEFYSA